MKGISQEYIASQLDLTTRAYSKIESGETQLTMKRLNEISEALDVTPYEILGFDEKYIFNNCNTAFANNQNYYAFSEQERTQFQKQIDHLESEILFLRTQVENLLKE